MTPQRHSCHRFTIQKIHIVLRMRNDKPKYQTTKYQLTLNFVWKSTHRQASLFCSSCLISQRNGSLTATSDTPSARSSSIPRNWPDRTDLIDQPRSEPWKSNTHYISNRWDLFVDWKYQSYFLVWAAVAAKLRLVSTSTVNEIKRYYPNDCKVKTRTKDQYHAGLKERQSTYLTYYPYYVNQHTVHFWHSWSRMYSPFGSYFMQVWMVYYSFWPSTIFILGLANDVTTWGQLSLQSYWWWEGDSFFDLKFGGVELKISTEKLGPKPNK